MAANTDTSTQSDPEAIDDTRRRRATTTETPRPAVGVKVALVGLTISLSASARTLPRSSLSSIRRRRVRAASGRGSHGRVVKAEAPTIAAAKAEGEISAQTDKVEVSA
jgi:hypothetical protein